MNPADTIALLAEATVASTVAMLLVLGLRKPLRRACGAGAGYAAWALVPIATTAVLVPARVVPAVHAVTSGMDIARGGAVVAAPPTADPSPWLLLAWSAGVLVMAGRFVLQQRAFERGLGVVRVARDGTHLASATAGLPAVVGLLRPRIVLPADFGTRYTPEQQRLLEAHERWHVRRGDPWVNACAAAFRCLWWFNPLVHLAARCLRHDQELACDARVLAARPQARRAYGEAMFNTQLAAQPLPLGCHWGFGHPLKERIEMLTRPMVTASRRRLGAGLLVALAGVAGFTAWAGQPPRIVAGQPAVAPAGQQLAPPGYPASAVANGQNGTVVLLVDLDAEGNPTAVEVESANPPGVFEAEATKAAMGWRFSPAIEDGVPVPSRVRVPVEFEADPPGTVTHRVPPKYPQAALAQGISGKVLLLVDIDAQGRPTGVAVKRAEPAGVFEAEATAAVRDWRFAPAVENGKAVASQILVPVHFEADGTPPEAAPQP